jgi:hypothetical protein
VWASCRRYDEARITTTRLGGNYLSSVKLVQKPVKSFVDELNDFEWLDEKKTEEVAETGGIVFPNGRCIELFIHEGRLGLLDSSDSRFNERIEYQGQTYVPPTIHPSLLKILRLPTERIWDSSANNFKHICTLFTERGISERAAKGLTYWAVSTWFAELFPLAPCLILTGSRPEANLVLQLLSCIVRHGLPLADISMSGFRFLPMHIQPTLLISNLSPATLRALSMSNCPGVYLPTKDGFEDLYCAKAIYAGDHLPDAALGSTFRVHLGSSHGKPPVISDCEQRNLAGDLQARLADYRIMHASQVRDSDFDVPALGSELRMLARVLGSAIIDAPDLRRDLVNLLRQYQEEIAAGNAFNVESIAVEALLSHSHSDEPKQVVYVGQLADTSNRLLKERGSRQRLEPKALGWTIRSSLGLCPTRNAKGFAIKLTEDVRRRIHQLACDFQVLARDEALSDCACCADILASKGAEEKLDLKTGTISAA